MHGLSRVVLMPLSLNSKRWSCWMISVVSVVGMCQTMDISCSTLSHHRVAVLHAIKKAIGLSWELNHIHSEQSMYFYISPKCQAFRWRCSRTICLPSSSRPDILPETIRIWTIKSRLIQMITKTPLLAHKPYLGRRNKASRLLVLCFLKQRFGLFLPADC